MPSILKPLFLVGAFLSIASLGTMCAMAEEEKSDTPVGYEEADKSTEEEETAKEGEPDADAPVGYEDAEKADKQEGNLERKISGLAVPALQQDAKALAEEEKLLANPQIKALADQMQQQLKPFFSAELSFAKNVCQPNPEQLQAMKDLAIPELRKSILPLAIQQAPQRAIVAILRRNHRQESKYVLDEFEAAAGRIVSQIFPPEVVQLYQEEQEHRKAFRGKAGAMALVVQLDKTYRLTPPQRKALTDSIQKVWQSKWRDYLRVMESNPQYFPPVPDEAVLPHLNAIQKKQWKATPRNDIHFHWSNLRNNQGVLRNMEEEFDWFEQPDGDAQENVQAPIQFDVFIAEPVKEAEEEQDE